MAKRILKWNIGALMLVTIGTMAVTTSARAQDAVPGIDGCAVLAQLIFTEVTTNAWYGSGGVRFATRRPVENRVTICSDTTRTVTTAFSAAMTSIGSEVRWGYPTGERGDLCLSGFLHQCYPERYPLGGANAWRAVSKTVQQAMPNGAASDQSIFSSAAMRLAIRSALATRDLRR